MPSHRNNRIRRAAILVASLEEELAEGLLRALPPGEVEAIYAQLETLEEVDPDEQQDVLDEFRRRTRSDARLDAGVEFTPSAAVVERVVEPSPPGDEARGPLHGVDHGVLARILSAEHPQTAAAALTRIGGEQGAAVFALLSASLQAEVIDRIVNLQSVDDAAAVELESQLIRRVGEWQLRQERRAASADLARKLVAHTAPSAREALLSRLRPLDDMPASDRGTPWTAASADQRAADLLEALGGASATRESAPQANEFPRLVTPDDEGLDLETADVSFEALQERLDAPAAADLDDCSRELESLGDRTLVTAMQQMDERVVLAALAASSDRLVRRVAKRLSRKNAAQLRTLLRNLGPLRLADLRAAQHELLATARSLAVPSSAA